MSVHTQVRNTSCITEVQLIRSKMRYVMYEEAAAGKRGQTTKNKRRHRQREEKKTYFAVTEESAIAFLFNPITDAEFFMAHGRLSFIKSNCIIKKVRTHLYIKNIIKKCTK